MKYDQNAKKFVQRSFSIKLTKIWQKTGVKLCPQFSFKYVTWLIMIIPWNVLCHHFHCNYYFHITLFLFLGYDPLFFQILLAKLVNTHQNGCQYDLHFIFWIKETMWIQMWQWFNWSVWYSSCLRGKVCFLIIEQNDKMSEKGLVFF